MSRHKAGGKSELIVDMLKEVSDTTIECITETFNSILSRGCYPESWETCLLRLLYKKGDVDCERNYRPINLLDVQFRVLETTTWARVKPELEVRLQDKQGGFRALRGTIEQLFVLITLIQTCIANGLVFYLGVLDLQKAYDSADQDYICWKLARMGLDAQSVNFLRTLLKNHKSELGVDTLVDILSGVLQGGILSPGFFNTAIDDMYTDADHQELGIALLRLMIAALLFADDTTILGIGQKEFGPGERRFQRNLDRASDWGATNGQTFHPDKCKVVVINGNAATEAQPNFQLSGQDIAFVSEAEVLGVVIDQSGQLRGPTTRKAAQTMGQLHKVCGGAYGFPLSTAINIWTSMLAPMMLYGSELGIQPSNEMRLFQNRFLRVALHAQGNVSVAAMMEFMGTIPIEQQFDSRLLKFAIRVLSVPSEIVQEALTVQKQNALPWIARVNQACIKYGLDSGLIWNGSLKAKEIDLAIGNFMRNHWRREVGELQSCQLLVNSRVSGEGNAGSSVIRYGAATNARYVFFLRYSMHDHYVRQYGLYSFIEPCSLCRRAAPSPIHYVFECNMDSVRNPDVFRRLLAARSAIRDAMTQLALPCATTPERHTAIMALTGSIEPRPLVGQDSFNRLDWNFLWSQVGIAMREFVVETSRRRQLITTEMKDRFQSTLDLPPAPIPRKEAPQVTKKDLIMQFYTSRTTVEYDAFLAGPATDAQAKYQLKVSKNLLPTWLEVVSELPTETEPKYFLPPRQFRKALLEAGQLMTRLTDPNPLKKRFANAWWSEKWPCAYRKINTAKTVGVISVHFLHPFPFDEPNWNIQYVAADYEGLDESAIPKPKPILRTGVKANTAQGYIRPVLAKYPNEPLCIKDGRLHCSICNSSFEYTKIDDHLKSKRHKNRKK
jgi:hypothetical protein